MDILTDTHTDRQTLASTILNFSCFENKNLKVRIILKCSADFKSNSENDVFVSAHNDRRRVVRAEHRPRRNSNDAGSRESRPQLAGSISNHGGGILKRKNTEYEDFILISSSRWTKRVSGTAAVVAAIRPKFAQDSGNVLFMKSLSCGHYAR